MTDQRKGKENATEYVVEKGLLVLQLAAALFHVPRRQESPSGKDLHFLEGSVTEKRTVHKSGKCEVHPFT